MHQSNITDNPVINRLNESMSDEDSEAQIVKICAFSPYRRRRMSKGQTLLEYKGKVSADTVSSSCCSILVDSGCELVCVSQIFADKLGLASQAVNLKAELWDGTLVSMKRSSVSLTLEIQNAKVKIRPYIEDLISYDVILLEFFLSQSILFIVSAMSTTGKRSNTISTS